MPDVAKRRPRNAVADSEDDDTQDGCAGDVIVLLGPPGCGKSAAVYAVAQVRGCG
jgi:ABC-type sugar transport system ATPase subunit